MGDREEGREEEFTQPGKRKSKNDSKSKKEKKSLKGPQDKNIRPIKHVINEDKIHAPNFTLESFQTRK